MCLLIALTGGRVGVGDCAISASDELIFLFPNLISQKEVVNGL
jgi:hypothetical protein